MAGPPLDWRELGAHARALVETAANIERVSNDARDPEYQARVRLPTLIKQARDLAELCERWMADL